MIQENQIPPGQLDLLESGLTGITTEFFAAPASVNWVSVGEGDGWTAGEPSTSSLVVMYVPAGLDQSTRTRLLTSICDLWTEVTGCSINEIVATARDT